MYFMENNKHYEDVQTLTTFGFSFIVIGTLIQLWVYFFTGSAFLSLISGITGIISVALCSNRKISFYVFGFIQLITYVILCIEQKLYGEIAENTFYFITMLYGLYHWYVNYNNTTQEVKTRNLNKLQSTLVLIGTTLLTLVLYSVLVKTDDTQPIMDAITTAPAFIAQTLMILRYKDSWYYWIIIDLGAIPMWIIAGDWCVAVQYVLWTINCLYGLKRW